MAKHKELEALKKDATKSAEFRGHRILWLDTITRRGMISNGVCACGEWVQVNTKPLPNDVNIGGSAVALNCTLAPVVASSRFNIVRGRSRTVGLVFWQPSKLYTEFAAEYAKQARRH